MFDEIAAALAHALQHTHYPRFLESKEFVKYGQYRHHCAS